MSKTKKNVDFELSRKAPPALLVSSQYPVSLAVSSHFCHPSVILAAWVKLQNVDP